MKKLKTILLLAILCNFVISCTVEKTGRPGHEEISQTANQTALITVEIIPSTTTQAITQPLTQPATAQVLPTRTHTPRPAPPPTMASWVILTPNVTLPLADAKENIEELSSSNGGCSLPCWWGIEPEKTVYTTALNQLSPLATFIAEKKNDDFGSLDAEFRFPVSGTISSRELTITYKVEKGVIELIEVNPGEDNQYRFGQLLKDYGYPEEIWVEGVVDPTSKNPFTIFLYYPNKGIVATFWVDAIDQGDKLQVCPGSIPAIILVLWEPDGIDGFIDIARKTYDLAYLAIEKRSLVLLEQTTEQTLDEIIESNCFETPKKLWLAR